MNKYFKYLWYVIRHKWYVFIECCKLGHPILGLLHDNSKFLPSEFIPYARCFYGEYWPQEVLSVLKKRSMTPEYYEHISKEKVDQDFDKAWLLHQHRNKHHWQYWILREDDGGVKKLRIPDKYLEEMYADWVGAGKAITGENNTREWYLKNENNIHLEGHSRHYLELLMGFSHCSCHDRKCCLGEDCKQACNCGFNGYCENDKYLFCPDNCSFLSVDKDHKLVCKRFYQAQNCVYGPSVLEIEWDKAVRLIYCKGENNVPNRFN